MNALVGKEKVLVGAFSGHCEISRSPFNTSSEDGEQQQQQQWVWVVTHLVLVTADQSPSVLGAHINNDCCPNLKSSKHRWPSKEDLTKKCAESLWIKLFILFPPVVCYYGTPVKSKQDAVLAAPGSYCRVECRVVYGWGDAQWAMGDYIITSDHCPLIIWTAAAQLLTRIKKLSCLCPLSRGCVMWQAGHTTPTPVPNIGLLPSTSWSAIFS